MKKIFILLIMAMSLIKTKAQQEENKTSGPVLVAQKVEVLCCGNSFKDNRKKIHVVSNAGWSTLTNIGVTIKDAAGNLIATYNQINGNFYSPCIALADGAVYEISIVDSYGNVILKDK
jgi:hypothetical protein